MPFSMRGWDVGGLHLYVCAASPVLCDEEYAYTSTGFFWIIVSTGGGVNQACSSVLPWPEVHQADGGATPAAADTV